MNRAGIFVFFDKEGVADDYIYYLLDNMRSILNRIVIVVNGLVDDVSYKRFRQYTDHIVIRENRGYDAGAYRDVILDYAEKKEWGEWDELLLFNDTFYGPFFDWNLIFEKMSEKDVDFWGLSKWLKGKSGLFEEELEEHLQGYFLVIRKRMFSSKVFFDFWRNLKQISTYEEVIYNFEVMFTVYHSEHGFRYASWLDGDEEYTKPGIVVYCTYPYDLIRDCSFPVIKRKAVSVPNFWQAGAALKYIESEYRYDTEMIWNHLGRIEAPSVKIPFTFGEIEHFVYQHKKVYLYGYGKWGHALERLFAYKGWKIANIIDSDVTKQSVLVRKLSDIQVGMEDGIIVALQNQAFDEVYPQLVRRFEKGQMLLPYAKRQEQYQ